jgi:hypothetical protein
MRLKPRVPAGLLIHAAGEEAAVDDEQVPGGEACFV